MAKQDCLLIAAVGTICVFKENLFLFLGKAAWVGSMAFWEIFRSESSYGVAFVTEIWGRMLMLLRVREGTARTRGLCSPVVTL